MPRRQFNQGPQPGEPERRTAERRLTEMESWANTHEEVCAVRYEGIQTLLKNQQITLDFQTKLMIRAGAAVIIGMAGLIILLMKMLMKMPG